jgi:TatD DNase family protein
MSAPKSPSLIDIGANLGHKSFRDDLDAVLERARAAGLEKIVVTGTSERASARASEIAAGHPGFLYATAGVHPHEARSCSEQTLARLRELCRAAHTVAVGECGLDFNRDFSPRPVQERWFEAQLELAAELGMPVFLHERDAHGRFAAILKQHRPRLVAGVVHCFTGTPEQARAYLDLDLHIGITGWICDERRGHHLREVVADIPADRLMLETDAPFLLPRDLRPKPPRGRNEPSVLPHVLAAVSTARGSPAAEVATESTAAARRFFGFQPTE